MSLSTFQRKFSETYNQSPAKYILNKKMDKARELLLLPDSRISDVAYDCGFEAVSTFNRVFKKTFNQSPSQLKMTGIE